MQVKNTLVISNSNDPAGNKQYQARGPIGDNGLVVMDVILMHIDGQVLPLAPRWGYDHVFLSVTCTADAVHGTFMPALPVFTLICDSRRESARLVFLDIHVQGHCTPSRAHLDTCFQPCDV